MKILLFGDIASGKSTVAKKIKAANPNFEIIAVDDFRRKFGDYTMQGEKIALKNFILGIKQGKNQIIEASGLGKVGLEIISKLSGSKEDILLVIFQLPIKEIKNRIKNRNWNIPFPGKQKNIDEIIAKINLEIRKNRIIKLWYDYNNIMILKNRNTDSIKLNFIIGTILNFIKLDEQ